MKGDHPRAWRPWFHVSRVEWLCDRLLFFFFWYCRRNTHRICHFRCAIQWHWLHVRCRAAVTTICFQNFPITPVRNSMPIKQLMSTLAYPPTLVTSSLLLGPLHLAFLDLSYKWNHTCVSFEVWLISLIIMFASFFHVMACQNFVPF